MKRILYSTLILLGLLSASCSNWLDVAPETEKDKDEFFSKESGFKNALTGAYIRMKNSNLYGKEMVCGAVEKLAQHWNVSEQDPFLNYDYRHANMESTMSSLYNNLYRVVTDVNGILEMIDDKQEVFKQGHYEIVKAEALGIRAFCHFDVLRLFGPMPSDRPSDRILPYVTTVSNKPNVKVTYDRFIELLMKDLDEAEQLLKDNDPICGNSIQNLNQLPAGSDRYWGYRQMRVNYYAVCAMKARIHLWNGQKEEALKYAKMVIDAKDPGGKPMYSLGNSRDCSNFDKVMSAEHILNLNVHTLSTTLGTGKAFEKDQTELQSRLYKDAATDIRLKYMWNFEKSNGVKHNYFTKYVQNKQMPELSKNALPLIRLYEMYLIAMECSSLPEAGELYKTMCVARDIEPVEFDSEEKLRETLVMEYNKEFYGEGQAFYAYKRMAVKDILYTSEKGSVKTYVIPLPKQENI